jgi:hypothetical protein
MPGASADEDETMIATMPELLGCLAVAVVLLVALGR